MHAYMYVNIMKKFVFTFRFIFSLSYHYNPSHQIIDNNNSICVRGLATDGGGYVMYKGNVNK